MSNNTSEKTINTHIESQHNQNSVHSSSANSEHSLTDSSAIHSESHEEGGNLITDLLSEHLLDHHSYSFYNLFKIDLPVILYDDGLHVYSSMNSMKESGTFTEIHHEIVRTDNHQPPSLDLSVTALVMFQWIAMIIIFISFFLVRKKYIKAPFKAPSGFQNFIEMGIEMVRERIVKVNIHDQKLADKLTPYFVSLWIFIFVLNFLGLIPGGHSATGNLAVTAGLALTAYFVINGSAIITKGLGHWIKEFTGGAPWFIWIVMIPIEILSMFTKPFALTIRLFANMTAGHVVILSLVGLIFLFKSFAVAPISVGFSLFINLLETLVAMIQAYVFTMLTSVFVGLALGHGEEHGTAH